MPIPLTCPHCGSQDELADEFAGRNEPCGRCGKAIAVPAAAAAESDSAPRDSSGAKLLLNLIAAGGVLLIVLTLMCAPFMGSSRTPSRKNTCKTNLRSIALAMEIYHNAYGSFPPAFIPDKDGRPMHSWRVLLLPYLEHKALFDQYHFEEPWNGPNNIRLADRMAACYRCPSDTSRSGSAETSYVMIVGPGTISDGPSATTRSEITDGTAETIMIVEMANSGIPWTEPRDLDAKDLVLGINSAGGQGIRSLHSGGANVLFCDGHVKSVFDSIPPETLQALSTIAGGEDVSDSGY